MGVPHFGHLGLHAFVLGRGKGSRGFGALALDAGFRAQGATISFVPGSFISSLPLLWLKGKANLSTLNPTLRVQRTE